MSAEREPDLDALFAAARDEPRDTARLEFGFETRLAARLREERGASIFAWAWRLCPFFAALAFAVGWLNYASMRMETEATIVAEVARAADEQRLLARFTGARR